MRTRRPPCARRARKPAAAVPALLARLRSGQLTERDFLRATSSDFGRMAQALMRGWDLPASVDVDDVAQELRIHVLATIQQWDPARGDLAPFCVFRASEKTSKWMHQQREAPKKDRGKAQSRYPLLLLDAVDRDEREVMLDALGHTEADQEQLYEAQERARAAHVLARALDMTVEELAAGVGRRAVRERARAVASRLGPAFGAKIGG